MSNVILNSNQNSALISTLRESDSSGSIRSPVIYAEDTIGPPHSIQIQAIEPVNTLTDYADKTISFDLPKQGYLCRMCLHFQVSHTTKTASSTKLDVGTGMGFLNYIDSVELLSSGRRVQEFDKYTILAKMSDQPHHYVKSYEEALKLGSAGVSIGATDSTNTTDVLLPLDMTFTSSLRHALNMDFVEPLRLRVRFAPNTGIMRTKTISGASYAALASDIPDVKLICEYRQLAASDADSAVQSNFGTGQLTQLVSTFAKAVPVRGGSAFLEDADDGETEKPIVCNLTENAAVESLYVMCTVDSADALSKGNGGSAPARTNVFEDSDTPLPIARIVFEASGQVIMDVPGEYLQHFGKRQDGVQRYAGTGLNADKTAYVYKIEFGYDNRFCSNVVSFRELSNPRLTIYPARHKGTKYTRTAHLSACTPTMRVVYETKQLMTTSAANGRVNLSISN